MKCVIADTRFCPGRLFYCLVKNDLFAGLGGFLQVEAPVVSCLLYTSKRIGCGYHANSPLSYKILWRYYTPFSRINRRICGTSQKYELAVNLLTNFLKKRKETGKMIQD